jgi:hypothetical protein
MKGHPMNSTYRVKISQGDFGLEIESHEREFVEEKLARYFPQSSPVWGAAATATPQPGKRLSFNEFIRMVNATSGTDYVVAIGYHLEKMEDLKEFSIKDIKEGFRRAKVSYSNPSQALVNAKTQGLVMLTSDGKYVLTSTGERFIESKLHSIDK